MLFKSTNESRCEPFMFNDHLNDEIGKAIKGVGLPLSANFKILYNFKVS